MENTLTFKYGNSEIQFSDLDLDKEIEVSILRYDKECSTYLTKENCISLKEHLNYVLSKM